MIITKTVNVEAEVEIEIDQDEFFEEISTDDLVAELESRDDYVSRCPDWDALYNLLANRRNEDAISFIRKVVEEKTGRIVP